MKHLLKSALIAAILAAGPALADAVKINAVTLAPKPVYINGPFKNFVVTCDGSVGPCGAQRFSLGNIHDAALRDLWNSDDLVSGITAGRDASDKAAKSTPYA